MYLLGIRTAVVLPLLLLAFSSSYLGLLTPSGPTPNTRRMSRKPAARRHPPRVPTLPRRGTTASTTSGAATARRAVCTSTRRARKETMYVSSSALPPQSPRNPVQQCLLLFLPMSWISLFCLGSHESSFLPFTSPLTPRPGCEVWVVLDLVLCSNIYSEFNHNLWAKYYFFFKEEKQNKTKQKEARDCKAPSALFPAPSAVFFLFRLSLMFAGDKNGGKDEMDCCSSFLAHTPTHIFTHT